MSVMNGIKKWFKKSNKDINQVSISSNGFFSSDFSISSEKLNLSDINKRVFQRTATDFMPVSATFAQDSNGVENCEFTEVQDESMQTIKRQFGLNDVTLNQAQLAWYASQSFIGYQACAILSQNWLINKACMMPARDAIRKGFEITVNDGSQVAPEILDEIRSFDKRYKLNNNLVEFVHMGRVFGIRIAKFVVESDDPHYYEKPFNIDGVIKGSYKGITQIDPTWITPQLDWDAAGNPDSMYFYEPTWWYVNGKRIHRTHLVIMRNNNNLPDILKPTYFYGGISVPQEIFTRVYASERTANEAPLLALTKRCTVINVDLAQALAKESKFEERMRLWSYFRDNYGIKVLGLKEQATQLDTSLADLDAAIMTQYQLVAAAARVPVTKLLGTTPKGFNATGEFDEASYHEELESIQTHDLTPLIERHHALVIRSEIIPKYNIEPFSVEVVWNSLDSMTAKEKAEINLIKSQTSTNLMASGAIDSQDERARIISDPDSGYSGLNLNQINPDEEIEEDPDESIPGEGPKDV